MTARSRDATPLVSVAMPVYNGAATVAEALRSMLVQTYTPIEIIVVDDGSTDGTWDVLQSFGAAIRPIRQANGGIAAARNAGLRAATGEFIALMDHDDVAEPERIAAQVKFLRERPELVLCCTDFSAFNATGVVSASYSSTYYHHCSATEGGVAARYPHRGEIDIADCLTTVPPESVLVPTSYGPIYEEIALGNFVHPPTILFRRAILADVGDFDVQVKIMCEWDWLVRVARIGPIGFLDRPLLRYRLSSSQVSFSEDAALDSVVVAQRICGRDPGLQARHAEEFRRLFGELYADAADSRADKHPLEALRLLATSVLRYHTITRQTPRTFLKVMLPAPLLEFARVLVEAAPPLL